MVALVALTSALFAAEIFRDFKLVKLSVPLMLLYVFPLTALHEAGHAIVSHVLGWRVCRVVVGYGPTVLRFRVRSVPVDVRLWPLGGYVIPAPQTLTRPRLESALIYAAGPAAEALLALLLLFVLGPERLLSPTDEFGTLAAQALLAIVAIDLVFNLVPLPIESERGQGLTDGLGMLLSPFPFALALSELDDAALGGTGRERGRCGSPTLDHPRGRRGAARQPIHASRAGGRPAGSR